jgi:hypothetical protein
MEDGDPRFVERRRVRTGVTGGGRDETDALIVHEVNDAWIAYEHLRDVHTEGLVGEVAHPGDLVARLIALTR